jgi:MFS family permease
VLNESNFRVGSLIYTRWGLLSVFFWMLWGDLCVNFMETVIPLLVPLQLDHLGAGKAVIGLVSASIPAGVELAINPFVSTYSDRFRSRWGRRRPFMFVCTPILAVCLLMVGLAPRIAPHLATAGIEPATMTILVIGVLLAIFQVFNVVVLATYYYMIPDVVPQGVIGRFTSMYKVFGALGGIVFKKYVYPHADQFDWQIYALAAAVYLVAFMLMCVFVKEGKYPAPPPLTHRHSGEAMQRWLAESFTIRFYQKLYLIGLFYYFAQGSVLFQQFFALNDLHMSKQAFGDAMAKAGLASLPIFALMGPIADRIHPVRAGTIGMALSGLSSLLSYFFIKDAHTFTLWTITNTVTTTVYLGGQISMLPRLFPREMYGQYCSSNNTLCAIGKFGGPVLAGWFISLCRESNRVNYLWTAAFAAGAVVAQLFVYLHWKRLGGDRHYVPPTVDCKEPRTQGTTGVSHVGRSANDA